MPPDFSSTMLQTAWLKPDWPAPANVRAIMTTRQGGVSAAPFDALNTATHVDDAPDAVAANRALLRQGLPQEPLWLNQIHGQAVARHPAIEMQAMPPISAIPDADACVAFAAGQVCVVQTADCLPVLFCDAAGTVVAAAHAGWRGLAAGVLENSVSEMGVNPANILAWMGAAIGPQAFEVGPEVREAFVSQHPATQAAFVVSPRSLSPASESMRYLADIYALARIRLASVGVTQVFGGGLCTYTDAHRFYSFRREHRTGRMASLIWLQGQ